MDRRWILGLLGLTLAGCVATDKSSGRGPSIPSGEGSPFDSYASIHQTINTGTRPSTKLASKEKTPAPIPDAPPAALIPLPSASPLDSGARQASTQPTGPVEPPQPIPLPEPLGRPAPFADVEPTTPRGQAPASDSGAGRPAPYAETEPAAPRPQSAPVVEPLPRPTQPTPAPAPPPLAAPPMLPPSDPMVSPTTGTDPSASLPKPKRDEFALIGRPAARVGDEIITVHQLRDAYKDKLDLLPPEVRANPAYKEEIIKRVLENMIDRTLILQAAKRQMKDPKQLKMFYEAIEKVWLEHEVPPLLKTYHATNVADLKLKLSAKGKSYDGIRQEFREETLAREFLSMRMKEKLTVSLPEMDKYYNKNLKQFDRPAQIVWREVVIDLSKYPTRAAAKQKMETLLARLRKGEDFASLAKTESSGPTASEGGKWETTPGSYGVPSVNDALNRLPVNQISPIIEAPASFHIVKVENRRTAGPAGFHEVQDQVREAVSLEKRQKAATGFLTALRENTIVSTMFDGPPSDPATIKVSTPTP